ncbi:MAG: hypothetical protein ACP5D0_08850 [Hydrogenovibrio sp.]
MKTPKPDVCTEPAYLFWKLQSRLTKLANQLAKLENAILNRSNTLNCRDTEAQR